MAELNDSKPEVAIEWKEPVSIIEIKLFVDTDYDHPLESILMGHSEDSIPFCVQNISVFNEHNEMIFELKNNHQTIIILDDGKKRVCKKLRIKAERVFENIPVSIFQVVIK